MQYRKFGKLGWNISEVGYGTWGMGGGQSGWKGSSDDEARTSLREAINLGCNFFDTAWIYGRGHSEELLGELIKESGKKNIFIGTKIPPKDLNWPSTRQSLIKDVFPEDHILEYTEKSLKNLDTDCIDLLQFHVWEDTWAMDTGWQKTIERLKNENIIKGVGISVNTWEPWNVLETLKTGLIDSVQVIYNVFEQTPQNELIPYCVKNNIAVIARVPFDEGSLTGAINLDTKFEESDWRNSYFVEENLKETIPRVQELKKILPANMSLPELALRFILNNPGITTVIPGMRKLKNVHANFSVSDGTSLNKDLLNKLYSFNWEREPTSWSQ